MTIEHSLLINEPFALRQRNGIPVYTKIETEIIPHSKELLDKYRYVYERGYKLPDVKKRIKTDYPINLINLDRIIITPMGKGYISTAFLEFMKEHNIPIYFVDNRGKIDSCFLPYIYKKPSTLVKQLEARTNGKGVEIAKYLIELKLESQGIHNMIHFLKDAKDIKTIMRIEGEASNAYWERWKFDKAWQWTGRHGRNRFMNTLAVDGVNSMLNFGYGLMAQRMSEVLIKKGFDPSIGFLHQNERKNKYWNMLSYDFIEPYRVWVEKSVKEMVDEKEILPSDFKFADDKSHMVFKDTSLEIALNRFTEVLSPLEHKSLPVIRQVEGMLG